MASKLNVSRGTTFTVNGIYQVDGEAADITGAAIRFTVKSSEWDTDEDDSDATIRKAGTIVSAPAGTYQIALSDTDTHKTPGTYFYDIKIELADGSIYKLDEGKFIIDGSPTNRTS